MNNMLVDARDQKFVLHEMLNIDVLCETPRYEHLSREVIDASLDAALKLAVNESYPIMAQADSEGCRLEAGSVQVPKCFHRLKEHYDQGKWPGGYLPREYGGQGLPLSVWAATFEDFVHNLSFLWVWASPFSGTNFILNYGSEEQKKQYLPYLASGKWGSTVAFTEEQAGCDDIAKITTVAVKQPDGTYRIKGNKPTVTSGDSDLFENIVHCVLARVEGDPSDASGLSLFIVPKYLVQKDGTLGSRNDYCVAGLEQKIGLHASPTVSINFGENSGCYAELLGEQGQALGMFIMLLSRCSFYGIVPAGIASAAYMHALDHARKRVQGPQIAEAANPAAKSVPIIAHPFVRRRLLVMKSLVEGLRALVYYSCSCVDKANALSCPAEREKWSGINSILFPVYRHYAAERAFKVTESAVKMRGRFGFYNDYPVHQLMRDIIPLSWWEGDSSGNVLFYLTQLMGQRGGQDFANLLTEMQGTIREFGELENMRDLAGDLQLRVEMLGELGLFFADCFKQGKAIVPIANGLPLIRLMGDICVAWLLFWQAGIATKRLAAIAKGRGVDLGNAEARSELLSQNKDAAFYEGKVHSARFFIKNVLPQADGIAAAIKSGDLSLMAIHDVSF